VITRDARMRVVTPEHPPDPRSGDTVIALAGGEPIDVR
jgi:hypothetical protein